MDSYDFPSRPDLPVFHVAAHEKTPAQHAHEILRAAVLNQTGTMCDMLIDCDRALHAGAPPRAVEIVPLMVGSFDPTAARAALNCAVALDAQPGATGVHFHNIRHFLSVAMATLAYATLAQANPALAMAGLSDEWRADCFNIALLHDIGHPGGDNRGVPFGIEQESWKLARPILIAAGYPKTSQRQCRMRDALLLTDPKYGRPIAWELARYHFAPTPDAKHDALAALGNIQKANGRDVAITSNMNHTIDHLIQRGLLDPVGALMSITLNRTDVLASIVETFPRTSCELHDEHVAVGGPLRTVCEKRLPLLACGNYFMTQIAHANEPHPVPLFRAIEQGRPEQTFADLHSGLFNDPAHAARRIRTPAFGKPTVQ